MLTLLTTCLSSGQYAKSHAESIQSSVGDRCDFSTYFDANERRLFKWRTTTNCTIHCLLQPSRT